MTKTIRIHQNDNVLIALEALTAGTGVTDEVSGDFSAVTDIPIYHKIAVRDIPVGAPVIKYGTPIGIATQPIAQGAHVHVHNLDSVDAMYAHVGGEQ